MHHYHLSYTSVKNGVVDEYVYFCSDSDCDIPVLRSPTPIGIVERNTPVYGIIDRRNQTATYNTINGVRIPRKR